MPGSGRARTLGDEVIAAAHIDRVSLHGYLVNIRGNNYSMRVHLPGY